MLFRQPVARPIASTSATARAAQAPRPRPRTPIAAPFKPASDRRLVTRRGRRVLFDMKARLDANEKVELIDLSAQGLCLQTTRRLVPGTTVDLHLERDGEVFSLRADVVRCTIAAVSQERVVYRAGVHFAASITGWLDGVVVSAARIA